MFTSALVWALSPLLTGFREPWDAPMPYYIAALVVAGAISGALLPKPIWAHYLGAVTGQILFELLFLRVGPLLLLGVVFLLAYSLVFVLAAAATGFVRRRLGPAESS